MLRKSPMLSFYVIAPLALGIGLNGAIFMLVDAFLLRPLPVRDPHNLVRIGQMIQNIGLRSYYSYSALTALQSQSTTLTDILGYAELNTGVRDASGASRVRVQVVSGNYFSALGVTALHGRVLAGYDAMHPSPAPPVVLSYSYWLRAFSGDAGAIGKTLTLGGRAFTIVGVTPQRFNGLDVETTPDVRLPLLADDGLFSRDTLLFTLAARLRPGVTLESARAETSRITDAVMNTRERNLTREEHVVLEPIARGLSLIRGKFSSALILLMAGVGLLLAMICANAGGLLLARASARREEMAVRLALGASSGRLVRQWLTESFLLTAIGAAAGLVVANAAIPLMVRSMPVLRDLGATALVLSVDIRPDGRLFAFAAALAIVCALFAGLPAALEARRSNLQSSLRSSRGTLRLPLRWALVTLQIGLCTFLLAGSGLLTATFRHLRAMDPGFDRDHVAAFSVDPGMASYSPRQAADFETRLLAAVRGIPGVRAAGIASIGLMHGTGIKSTVAPAGQVTPRSDFMNASLNFVTPEYFEAMGIPLLAGRNFGANEPASKPAPAIVNQAFVRRFFPADDPLGKTFGIGANVIVKGDYQIAGVVGDSKYRSLREPIPPVFYQFRTAERGGAGPFILHVRAYNRPEGVLAAVRKSLNEIDPRLPFYEVHTLAEEVDATLWSERLLAWLSAAFALVAATLATMGVHAALAFAIAQSRREIGIRVALGARAADVLRLFSARPLRFACLGVAAGMAGFAAATPAFRTVLYEVSPADPVTLVSSVLGVLLIAAAATSVAVTAALRVDPAVALRNE